MVARSARSLRRVSAACVGHTAATPSHRRCSPGPTETCDADGRCGTECGRRPGGGRQATPLSGSSSTRRLLPAGQARLRRRRLQPLRARLFAAKSATGDACIAWMKAIGCARGGFARTHLQLFAPMFPSGQPDAARLRAASFARAPAKPPGRMCGRPPRPAKSNLRVCVWLSIGSLETRAAPATCRGRRSPLRALLAKCAASLCTAD